MAVVQNSYSETMRPAVAGMVANLTNADADTRIVETAAGIGFGLAVGQGAAAKGAVLGAAVAAGFVGISIRDVVLDPRDGDIYRQGASSAVLTEGDIWAVTGGAVAAGDNVVFEAATGILSSLPADATHFAIAGARWMTGAANGGLAVVRLGGALPSV
ncbi:MAG: structural cement protein Gp24 [Inquilinus sp.]|uniref:structural cement protein Gp24 n=1 Tax=Inquilinus sp. TaxID=1932117 RepID=UPI003F33DB7E